MDGNPLVFLDLAIDGAPAGRIIFELRSDIVPKTAEEFRVLCTGEQEVKSSPGGRKCLKDRIYPGRCEGGDLQIEEQLDGPDDTSVYFKDENFILRHTGPGILSMLNSGPDTNGTKFAIMFAEAPIRDNRHVVFGYAFGPESFQVLLKVQKCGSRNGMPTKCVQVVDCGQLYPINDLLSQI